MTVGKRRKIKRRREMYVDYLLSSLRPLMSLMRGPFTGARSATVRRRRSQQNLHHHTISAPVQPQLRQPPLSIYLLHLPTPDTEHTRKGYKHIALPLYNISFFKKKKKKKSFPTVILLHSCCCSCRCCLL